MLHLHLQFRTTPLKDLSFIQAQQPPLFFLFPYLKLYSVVRHTVSNKNTHVSPDTLCQMRHQTCCFNVPRWQAHTYVSNAYFFFWKQFGWVFKESTWMMQLPFFFCQWSCWILALQGIFIIFDALMRTLGYKAFGSLIYILLHSSVIKRVYPLALGLRNCQVFTLYDLTPQSYILQFL